MLTIPIDIPIEGEHQKAGAVINGVVLEHYERSSSWIDNPYAQIFWQTATPYVSYSKPQARTINKSNGPLFYNGSLPDTGQTFYVDGVTGKKLLPVLHSYWTNQSNLTSVSLLRNQFVVGNYNASHVWSAESSQITGNTYYYLTRQPLNVTLRGQETQPLSFPYHYYSVDSPSEENGCTVYNNPGSDWHHQICGFSTTIRSFIEWPIWAGNRKVTASSGFYRNYLSVTADENTGFTEDEDANVEHISADSTHYGTIVKQDSIKTVPALFQVSTKP